MKTWNDLSPKTSSGSFILNDSYFNIFHSHIFCFFFYKSSSLDVRSQFLFIMNYIKIMQNNIVLLQNFICWLLFLWLRKHFSCFFTKLFSLSVISFFKIVVQLFFVAYCVLLTMIKKCIFKWKRRKNRQSHPNNNNNYEKMRFCRQKLFFRSMQQMSSLSHLYM